MKKLLLATNNKDKVFEIKQMLENLGLEILTLNDLNIHIEIDEDKETLEGNSLKKAETIFKLTQVPCCADDTGLFIEALNNEPGVRSSRYAGENVTYEDNRKKVIKKLEEKGCLTSPAEFRTVICYYYADGEYKFFEGICPGTIETTEKGEFGFGYDPIFVPTYSMKTFGEMNTEEKNMHSHRAKAFQKFKDFLATSTDGKS